MIDDDEVVIILCIMSLRRTVLVLIVRVDCPEFDRMCDRGGWLS